LPLPDAGAAMIAPAALIGSPPLLDPQHRCALADPGRLGEDRERRSDGSPGLAGRRPWSVAAQDDRKTQK
jgi:hypothetical protein